MVESGKAVGRTNCPHSYPQMCTGPVVPVANHEDGPLLCGNSVNLSCEALVFCQKLTGFPDGANRCGQNPDRLWMGAPVTRFDLRK